MAVWSGLLSRLRGQREEPQEIRDRPPPLSTDDVLRAEAKAIRGDAAAARTSGRRGTALNAELNKLSLTGLCLSGGGIRSAAFALGVVQAFAAHPRSADGEPVGKAEDSLLAKFDYLSTVSGGGYIGSWLSAWRRRDSFETVWNNLVGRPDRPDVEPAVIAWLRSYSNYLTPQLGFMSADSWALAAVYVRNLIVNWLVILPAVCAAILAVKFVVVLLIGLSHINHATHPRLVIVGLGIVFLLVALSHTTQHRPSRLKSYPASSSPAQDADRTFLLGNLVWSILSAILLTQYLGIVEARGSAILQYPRVLIVAMAAAAGAVIYASGWLLGMALAWRRGQPLRRDGIDFGLWSMSGLFYGSLVGIGFFFFLRVAQDDDTTPMLNAVADSPVVYLIFGVPWILTAQWVADLVFIGLTSYREKFNADQEWLGRSGAWLWVATIGWSLGMFVTFAGFLTGVESTSASRVFDFMREWVVPITVLGGLLIALVGTSNLSRFNFGTEGVISFLTDLAIALAAPLFVGALIFSLSILLDQALLGRLLFAPDFLDVIDSLRKPVYGEWLATLKALAIGFIVSTLLAVAASRNVNINRFSLHALYRNRLVRAFLGASRGDRKPDPFTGFDDDDDPRMHDLWPSRDPDGRWPTPKKCDWRPFHVVNLTLNIVSSRRLAWQERKAAPFTVTPLHCGTSAKSDSETTEAGTSGAHPGGAYRPSAKYGDPRGMTLGTAMAISGAAANPNMGYHTSPSVTFLMTMFNVRLGWWLGNPGAEGAQTYRHEGPAVAILPLLHETLGLTTDTSPYIHVSDGGHFENLGLYEMVRRRCRVVVISDAGRDPSYAFEDLGNAVRKISIDLGVPIRFKKLEMLKRRPADGGDVVMHCDYHAIAEIDYQDADGEGVENGWILYVKAGYHGTESAGVRSYAMANVDFPHQSTANQWFSESQFESYRSLGFEIMENLLTRAREENKTYADDPSLDNLLTALKTMPSDPAADPHPELSRPPKHKRRDVSNERLPE